MNKRSGRGRENKRPEISEVISALTGRIDFSASQEVKECMIEIANGVTELVLSEFRGHDTDIEDLPRPKPSPWGCL
jgi:hypothetical protein